jgi:hypothetical protein
MSESTTPNFGPEFWPEFTTPAPMGEENIPIKVGDLVDVLIATRTRAQGVKWVPARITAITTNPENVNEKVFRIKTYYEGPYIERWAYKRPSIRRPKLMERIAEFANDEIEKISPYEIKYEYDTTLDPNDPPEPFDKDKFLKSMIDLSEYSQRAAGVGGDTGLVVEIQKGTPAHTVRPESQKSVKEMLRDLDQQIIAEAQENRRKKGLE